ncbi:hypothetical protein LCGC14_2125180 [marine sediment metagenome]|uniref:Uncharacterized protein n=1 Tax=marine sediment metagenome TaxID=412755 RepID=A0A0F9E351_9ZZZZ
MPLLINTDVRPDNEIKQAMDEIIAYGMDTWKPLKFEGEYPTTGFGLSILRPRNVGIANDFWQMTVTTSFADWINDTGGDNEIRLVTGVFNLTIDPGTSELFPSANGLQMPYFNIEHLYATSDVARAWLTKPFAVKDNNNVTIQAVGRVAGTERLGLMGHIIGKRSLLIDATP